jgi:hypothetical protein
MGVKNMKKILSIIALLLVVLLAANVFATPTVGNVLLSESNAVERSNPQLYGSRTSLDDERELKYVRFSIPVTAGNESVNVTNVVVNIPSSFVYNIASPITSADISRVVNTLPQVVPANSTVNIDVEVLVPANLNAVDVSFNRALYDAGLNAVLTIDALPYNSNLAFYVQNNLELRRLTIVTPERSIRCTIRDSNSLDCDNEIRELTPGEDFTADLEIRNRFSRTSRVDFDDVDISFNDDRDVEVDRTTYTERLRAGEELTLSVKFRVDSRVEDGDSARIYFDAETLDSNNARHGFKYDFEVRFELPRAEVKILSPVLQPTSVCRGEMVVVTFGVENIGRDDQKNLYVKVGQDEFNWERISERFVLNRVDRGRTESRQFTYTFVVPTNARIASHPVNVEVFYQDDRNRQTSKWETLSLVVRDCTPASGSNGVTTNQTTTIVVDNGGSTGSTATPVAGTTVVATAKPKSDVALITGLLIVGLLLLAVIALFVIVLRR